MDHSSQGQRSTASQLVVCEYLCAAGDVAGRERIRASVAAGVVAAAAAVVARRTKQSESGTAERRPSTRDGTCKHGADCDGAVCLSAIGAAGGHCGAAVVMAMARMVVSFLVKERVGRTL